APEIIAGSLMLLLLFALTVIVLLQVRTPRDRAEMNFTLQNLLQGLQESRTQLAVLADKVARLEPMTETISSTLSAELAKVQQNLTALQTLAKARQDVEQQAVESIKRLELIIAGAHSKGAAGESIVEQVFAKLPIEWQERNLLVNGKVVEFGLRLPSNLIVPIDSKWPATDLLERAVAVGNREERERLKRELERLVVRKAEEAGKYIVPGVTTSFAVAVVPDSVYEICSGALSKAFQSNVVLVSYSMFVPYLFLIIHTAVKTLHSIDLQKLDAYLETIQNSINNLQEELDGRFARALTMLSNARDEMRAQISKASGSLTSLQISAPATTPRGTLPPQNDFDE
ncbi:MAG: DNA recombination protein RmuC, partial [candidate division KSB1 bacterium]|nr:DNA recombination protein RmuC [candidate division KSB1 bacterium]